MSATWWAISLVISGTLIGAFGPIYLKKGAHAISLRKPQTFLNKHTILGLTFYGASTIIFIPALRGGDVSTLYPLVSLTYIWVNLLSAQFLFEHMTRLKWIGTAFILLGVSFIGFGA